MKTLVTVTLIIIFSPLSLFAQAESLEDEFQFRFESPKVEDRADPGRTASKKRPQRDPSSEGKNNPDVETFRGPGGSGPIYWRFASPDELDGFDQD